MFCSNSFVETACTSGANAATSGVRIIFSRSLNPDGIYGSSSNTSRAAPAIIPALTARTSASASTSFRG
ncbi:hypothetical protein ACVWWO_007496 [Bradyrhizobium sp. F1.13.1]